MSSWRTDTYGRPGFDPGESALRTFVKFAYSVDVIADCVCEIIEASEKISDRIIYGLKP